MSYRDCGGNCEIFTRDQTKVLCMRSDTKIFKFLNFLKFLLLISMLREIVWLGVGALTVC